MRCDFGHFIVHKRREKRRERECVCVCVCVCACVRVSVSVSVCLCVSVSPCEVYFRKTAQLQLEWSLGNNSSGKTVTATKQEQPNPHTDTQTHTHTQTQTNTHTHKQTHRHRQTHTHTSKHTAGSALRKHLQPTFNWAATMRTLPQHPSTILTEQMPTWHQGSVQLHAVAAMCQSNQTKTTRVGGGTAVRIQPCSHATPKPACTTCLCFLCFALVNHSYLLSIKQTLHRVSSLLCSSSSFSVLSCASSCFSA